MLRALFIAVFFFTMTPLLITAQWLVGKLRLPGWGVIAAFYYRVLCALLRIHVHVVGHPVRDRPVLLVSNHVSWADILVIGSVMPVAFVAKREVGDWPLVGATARLQRTVFVDRARRHQTAATISQIVDRMAEGIPVVLFAEGTSSDGNRVLPFRTALIGAVRDACAHTKIGKSALIQPMSICYVGTQGLPMGRQHRHLVAWYGALEFVPHFKEFIERTAVDAVVTFGEAFPAEGAPDRKELAKSLESSVRRLTAATLRGRAPRKDKAQGKPAVNPAG